MINQSMNRWKFSLWIAVSIYFIISLVISLSYYWGYMSSINDIGRYDQAIWGTLHGNFFLNTNTPFNVPMNYLGIHFRPILIIFIPFYAILPKPEWMILTQSFALSLAAWPIYLLAKHISKSESAAFLWVLVYMLNPFVFNVPPWVFRPESLAVPFIAIALLSIEKLNFRLLLLSCFFIALCKEHFGIMVIGFGFLWGLRNQRWKQAILLVSFGAIYSILVLGVIMPSLSPIGKHVMLGKGLGQLSRYSWLGGSLSEIFKNLLFHPIFVIKTVMLEMDGASYLFLLLVPFLGFPLAAPQYLLPGLADFAANILSANPMPKSIFAYHSVSLIPVITVAAICGTERVSRWTNRFSSKKLASFVVIITFIISYYCAPLPLPGARNVWTPVHSLNLPDKTVNKIRYAIGEEASVSAQANIGSFFTQRREIYRYPDKVGNAETIILRLESPAYSAEALRQNLGMELSEYLTSIESLLSGTEYGIFIWNDPWLVMKKGKVNQKYQKAPRIEEKLNQIREKWDIP